MKDSERLPMKKTKPGAELCLSSNVQMHCTRTLVSWWYWKVIKLPTNLLHRLRHECVRCIVGEESVWNTSLTYLL